MAEGLTALFANATAAVFAVALPAWSQSSTTQDHNHGGGLTALFANVPAR